MKLNNLIEFLRDRYNENEDIFLADLDDYKTVVLSNKEMKNVDITWLRE